MKFLSTVCVITCLLFCTGCTSCSSNAEEAESVPSETSASQGEAYPVWDVTTALAEAKATNSDVVGWLIVPGTTINEPAVQADNNTHYLRRSYKGGYAYSGSLFFDYRAFPQPPGQNCVIYGHNLGSPMGRRDDPEGEKFAQLLKFVDLDFAARNPYIYFITEKETYVYRIFCVAYTEAYTLPIEYHHNRYPEQQFKQLTLDLQERSLYDYGVSMAADDRLLTLSTCTYKYGTYSQNSEQRFIVVARLVREGEPYEAIAKLQANTNVKQPPFAVLDAA